MKRKIFSKLLMVALVIAAVGSFVSCKDYDDDINNLQKQIDNAALKSSVESLEKTLNDKIAAAQSAAQAAQTAADKAATTANAAVTKSQLDDAISAAKTAAQTAAETYADKVAAAAKTDAAKDAYDQAKAYVDAEVAKVTAAIPSEAAIKAIADASAAALDEKLATELKAWVNEQIADIDVEGQVEAAVAKAIEKIDTAADNVAAIWSAVTEIEIVQGGRDLLFFQGKQAVTYTFGKETSDVAADQYQEYTKGEDIIFRNNVLVRVNPVNATFDPADVKLVNSLGENLNDLVKIQKVEKYNHLITRADETGLWMITFAREDGATDAQFAKATKGAEIKGNTKRATGKAAYAIAINNEQDAAAKRFVVTDYWFGIRYGEYVNTKALNFSVDGQRIAELKNRWNGNKVVAEDNTKAQSPADYKWIDSYTITTPAAEIVLTPAASKNVVDDARVGGKYVYANVDEPFEITGIDMSTIDYYYVVLDKDCAIESNPSEVRAWESYEYDGINTKVESGKDLQITINSTGADPEGDIIGFRVFAVNYDGLLADPDGTAFYVQVGDEKTIPTIAKAATFNPTMTAATFGTWGTTRGLTDVMVSKDNNVVFACDFSELGLADDITLAGAKFPAAVTATNAANKTSVAKDVTVYVNYLTSDALNLDGSANEATRVNDVKFVSLTVKNPEDIIDNSTFNTNPVAIQNPDSHGKTIGNLVFSIKKPNVTAAPTNYVANPFSWKSDYAPAGGVLTVYPLIDQPAGAAWTGTDYTTAANKVVGIPVDLHNYANNLLTGALNHTAVATYTAGDFTQWIEDGTATWTYNATKRNETSAANWDGTIAPQAQFVGPDAAGKKHTIALKATSAGAGEAISLTWAAGSAKTDASATATPIQTTGPVAPDYQVFNTNIYFDNILNYEEYSMNHEYADGIVGAKSVMKQNKYWLKWSALDATTGIALREYYKSALDGATTPAAITQAGVVIATASVSKDWTTKVLSLAAMLNVAKNTKVASFGGNTFAPGFYYNIDIAGAHVVADDGSVDQYVVISPASTITNIGFLKSTGMPTRSMQMNLVVTATDCFGFKHELKVPFELDVTEP